MREFAERNPGLFLLALDERGLAATALGGRLVRIFEQRPRERGTPTPASHFGDLLLADTGIPPLAFDRVGIETRGLFDGGDLVRIIR